MVYLATESDIDELADLRAEQFRVMYPGMDLSGVIEDDKEILHNSLNGSELIAAYKDDRIVSCSILSLDTNCIYGVYTHPEYRRKGYAAECLKLLFSEAKKRQIRKIDIFDATVKGQYLYDSLGLRRVCSHGIFKDYIWENEMEKLMVKCPHCGKEYEITVAVKGIRINVPCRYCGKFHVVNFDREYSKE